MVGKINIIAIKVDHTIGAKPVNTEQYKDGYMSIIIHIYALLATEPSQSYLIVNCLKNFDTDIHSLRNVTAVSVDQLKK